jgi:hypothetical protein
MLISMPTGTSTIFGVFQLIGVSQVVWRDVHAEVEPRTGSDVMQVPGIGAAHGRIGEAVEHSSGNRSPRSEWPIERSFLRTISTIAKALSPPGC